MNPKSVEPLIIMLEKQIKGEIIRYKKIQYHNLAKITTCFKTKDRKLCSHLKVKKFKLVVRFTCVNNEFTTHRRLQSYTKVNKMTTY